MLTCAFKEYMHKIYSDRLLQFLFSVICHLSTKNVESDFLSINGDMKIIAIHLSTYVKQSSIPNIIFSGYHTIILNCFETIAFSNENAEYLFCVTMQIVQGMTTNNIKNCARKQCHHHRIPFACITANLLLSQSFASYFWYLFRITIVIP